MSLPLIEGLLKSQLLLRVTQIAPQEAVGIIFNDEVHLLANRAEDPESSFAVYLSDLSDLVTKLHVPLDKVEQEVILWHSHPNGGVGPSREDMRNRTPLNHHLVVSLVDGDLVATWY